MARKTMTKEVTKTTVKLSKIENVNGQPQAKPMEDQILIGNVSADKAQREITKQHGTGVTVFEVIPETTKYQMSVEDFIKHADVVKDEPETNEQ